MVLFFYFFGYRGPRSAGVVVSVPNARLYASQAAEVPNLANNVTDGHSDLLSAIIL